VVPVDEPVGEDRRFDLKSSSVFNPESHDTEGSTPCTDATGGTTPSTFDGRDHFTPMKGEENMFQTPCGQTITVTYEDLGITPSKMYPIGDVLNWIERDGFWNVDTKKPSLVLALLVYLYGKGIYNDLDAEE
jgi:hypothetical protein